MHEGAASHETLAQWLAAGSMLPEQFLLLLTEDFHHDTYAQNQGAHHGNGPSLQGSSLLQAFCLFKLFPQEIGPL
jgi:hypothetical protein